MRILYVRADAGHAVGIGHIMRCMAIAQTWQQNGGDVCFLTKPIVHGLSERINNEQFQHILLDENTTVAKEIKTIASLVGKEDVVLLDGYHFDETYQQLLKAENIKLAVVDDFSHAKHYYADVVINRNLIAKLEMYINKKEAYTKLLLGPEYNYVRKEFTKYDATNFKMNKKVKHIFINFGGSDPQQLTIRVLKLLDKYLIEEAQVTVVIGAAYKDHAMLRACIKQLKLDVTVLENVHDMANLMFHTDIAITAGGTTLFELAYLGVPNIAVKVASNQKSIDLFAKKYETTYAIDALNAKFDAHFYEYFKAIQMLENRTNMHKKAKQLIDSKGNQRIVDALMKI